MQFYRFIRVKSGIREEKEKERRGKGRESARNVEGEKGRKRGKKTAEWKKKNP